MLYKLAWTKLNWIKDFNYSLLICLDNKNFKILILQTHIQASNKVGILNSWFRCLNGSDIVMQHSSCWVSRAHSFFNSPTWSHGNTIRYFHQDLLWFLCSTFTVSAVMCDTLQTTLNDKRMWLVGCQQNHNYIKPTQISKHHKIHLELSRSEDSISISNELPNLQILFYTWKLLQSEQTGWARNH